MSKVQKVKPGSGLMTEKSAKKSMLVISVRIFYVLFFEEAAPQPTAAAATFSFDMA